MKWDNEGDKCDGDTVCVREALGRGEVTGLM